MTPRMNLQGRGRLFVLSGPSGAGKGTLRKKAFESLEGIVFSISCTTRPVREGERDGVDYRVIAEEAFRDLLGRGKFLEHAVVHGHYYGTLREDVENAVSDARHQTRRMARDARKQAKKLEKQGRAVFDGHEDR